MTLGHRHHKKRPSTFGAGGFRYIEEALMEVPLNIETETKELEVKPIIAEATREKKALRPKAKAFPKEPQDRETQSFSPTKPLVENMANEEVYASPTAGESGESIG